METAREEKPKKGLKERQTRIVLWNGDELQYHCPRPKGGVIELKSFIPENFKSWPLEVEIGPGKGEYIANRAAQYPDRFFIGIDRRVDRVRLTEKKLKRLTADESNDHGSNWIILREDARCFLAAGIPSLNGLHLYQPDPWPKDRQNKHRFFRSPDAKVWATAVISGGFFSFSTDHQGYFEEMMDIVKTWDFLKMNMVWKKTRLSSKPKTHFEGIFLRQNKPVFKALYTRI